MVSEEERDEMWRAFSPDRRARLNIVRAFGPGQFVIVRLDEMGERGIHTCLSPVFKTPEEVEACSPLFLDMTREVDIRIDRDTLSVEAQASISTPEKMEALHAEVQSTRYQRSFSLSGELDTDNVEANLKDGVLTLRIHKRAEHQPRRIEVRGA